MTSENPSTRTFTDAARKSTGSFELVLGPVLMALLGLAIDSWLGTTPLFILLLTLWGVIGAGVSLYYRYRSQVAAVVERGSRGGDPR